MKIRPTVTINFDNGCSFSKVITVIDRYSIGNINRRRHRTRVFVHNGFVFDTYDAKEGKEQTGLTACTLVRLPYVACTFYTRTKWAFNLRGHGCYPFIYFFFFFLPLPEMSTVKFVRREQQVNGGESYGNPVVRVRATFFRVFLPISTQPQNV